MNEDVGGDDGGGIGRTGGGGGGGGGRCSGRSDGRVDRDDHGSGWDNYLSPHCCLALYTDME